jgi:hypothetical protein
LVVEEENLPASCKKNNIETGRGYCKSLAPACAKPLRRRQGGTFGSLLHAFLGKPETSRKVISSITLDTFDGAKPRFLNRSKKRRSVSTLSIPRASDRGVEWVDFLKIRNCKGLEVPLPGFDVVTSGFTQNGKTKKNPYYGTFYKLDHRFVYGKYH